MKRVHWIKAMGLLVAFMAMVACDRAAHVGELCIVPEPMFAVQKEGMFTLPESPKLSVVGLGQNSSTVKYIIQSMRHAHLHPKLVASSLSSDIELSLYDTLNPELGSEGYLLEVRTSGIVLKANSECGLFYAYQTLLQILPPDVAEVRYRSITLPECTVLDRPRFEWRGVEMDAAHLSFGPKAARKWIDLLSAYKMNHLHMVLDEGDEVLSENELMALQKYAADRYITITTRWCDSVAPTPPPLWEGDSAVAMPRLFTDIKHGIEAARRGEQVLMSPEDEFNLAVYQADARYQPASTEGMNTLRQVYAVDPVPQGTNRHIEACVRGGMCRMNTGLIGSDHQAEYMLLPRMLAVSECLWSSREGKDWMRFRRKIEDHKDRLQARGCRYCEGSFTPQFTARRVDDATMNIAIATEVPNTYIFYTTDLSTPTMQSSIYLGPINLRRGTHIKILPVYKGQERDSVYEYIIK